MGQANQHLLTSQRSCLQLSQAVAGCVALHSEFVIRLVEHPVNAVTSTAQTGLQGLRSIAEHGQGCSATTAPNSGS